MRPIFFVAIFAALALASGGQAAAQTILLAKRIGAEVHIDGSPSESFWQQCPAAQVTDKVANIPITLRAAHNGDRLFLLVQFADPTENRDHRSLVWDPLLKAYKNGPSREDVFVLKWSMVNYPTSLTLAENKPYKADIWFWKAHRTDPMGYADDKMHFYWAIKKKKSKMLTSADGSVFYLQRLGDKGEATYSTKVYSAYQGEHVAKYEHQSPAGSRADIKAKGHWQQGQWHIEFSRKLDTGHGDDVKLQVGALHPFGVSRYEIAGRKPEPRSEQPLYGSGEVGQLLHLKLAP